MSTQATQPPQLPARPSKQPSSDPPKKSPNLPPGVAPSSSKRRATRPPPTISEDDSTTEGERGSLKYMRDPNRLIAYAIPLPKPKLSKNLENEDALPDVSASKLENISTLTFVAISNIYATATALFETCERNQRAKDPMVQEKTPRRGIV